MSCNLISIFTFLIKKKNSDNSQVLFAFVKGDIVVFIIVLIVDFNIERWTM